MRTRASTALSSVGDGSASELTEDMLSPPETTNLGRYPFAIAPYSKTDDPAVRWFYQPSFLAVFFAACAGTAALAHFSPRFQLPDRVYDHLGVASAVGIFLVTAMLQFRDGPFSRPHPAVWRIVLATNLLYLLAIAFLYFHDVAYAREALRFFDRDLGRPVVEGTHDASCELTPTNFYNALDHYALAHALGWFGKALILRDWWLLLILSVSFEMCEVTFSHVIPIFRECWWDRWGLDVFGCNLIGAWAGMKLCKALGVSHFSWRGRRTDVKVPFDLAKFDWRSVSRMRNYLSSVALLTVLLGAELNVFFLKQLLWVPSDNPLVSVRLAFIFAWALPATREYYEYVSHSRRIVRMGSHAAMLLSTVALELLCIVKWSQGELTEPMPPRIKIAWAIFLTGLVVYPLKKFGIRRRHRRNGSRPTNGSAAHAKSR